jgi:hypothetical protein
MVKEMAFPLKLADGGGWSHFQRQQKSMLFFTIFATLFIIYSLSTVPRE